jgi:RHS repeat-associated protein
MNSLTVSASTNRITSAGFSYDASGNMTNDRQYSYTYDAENRAKTGAGATYSYDGAGLRVKKVAGATTTRYIFSGVKVIAEYVNGAAVGSPTREYIYSGSALLATIEGATTTYHHQDHLSVRVNTNTSGTVVAQQGNFPFGEAWYTTSTTTKWRFTSYERDAESGNDYAIFRSYSNRLGRFTTPDPIAGSITDPQSLNRYVYVLNDPPRLIDPLGLVERPIADPFVTDAAKQDCSLDGFAISCDLVLQMMQTTESARQCPKNDCASVVLVGEIFYRRENVTYGVAVLHVRPGGTTGSQGEFRHAWLYIPIALTAAPLPRDRFREGRDFIRDLVEATSIFPPPDLVAGLGLVTVGGATIGVTLYATGVVCVETGGLACAVLAPHSLAVAGGGPFWPEAERQSFITGTANRWSSSSNN